MILQSQPLQSQPNPPQSPSPVRRNVARLWQQTLFALGAAGLVWGGLGLAPAAHALSEEEVSKRLSVVPIFSVFQKDGTPVIVFPNQPGQNPSEQKISDGAMVNFFDPKEVQAFLQRLQQQNPQDLKEAGIVVSSLGDLYRWRIQNKDKPDLPRSVYAAMETEIKAALELLRQTDSSATSFPGIPLFVAVDSSTEGGYLTMQENNNQVVPFFFRREDLQGMLERFKQQQPDIITRAKIQPVSLERLISELEKGAATDPFVASVRLIPPRDALDFIRSVQQQAPQSGPGAQPGPAAPRPGTQPGPAAPRPGAQPSPAAPR